MFIYWSQITAHRYNLQMYIGRSRRDLTGLRVKRPSVKIFSTYDLIKFHTITKEKEKRQQKKYIYNKCVAEFRNTIPV